MSKPKNSGSPSQVVEARSQEEIGAAYFEEHKDCPVDSILVGEDGTIFYNTMKGKNLADNYASENKKDVLTFYKEVSK